MVAFVVGTVPFDRHGWAPFLSPGLPNDVTPAAITPVTEVAATAASGVMPVRPRFSMRRMAVAVVVAIAISAAIVAALLG